VIKFSVSTVLFPELKDREEIVNKVADAGYDGIEWRVQTDYHIPPDDLEREASAIRKICDRRGLATVCLATYLRWDELKKIESVARGAKLLGCPRIRLAGFNYDGKEDYWAIYDRACKQIAAAAPILKKVGVKGLIETHFGTIHASAHGAYNVLRHFDPKVIGVILDGSNLIVEGWENWSMVVSVLKNYLDHVHVRNAAWQRDAAKGWHWTWASLEDGMADWREIMRVLQAHKYDGYITNENILGVPTSSKGYIGEAHASLGGYDNSRTIEQRLGELSYVKSLLQKPAASKAS
jgi:sugar phosphate isomerase/epimerase